MTKSIQQKRAEAPLISFKYAKVDVTKVNADSRTISGYLAVYNNIDAARDRIMKGAFAKSINDRGPGTTNGNKIAFLWQHDMTEPLGMITVLKEDDFGLYFECVISKITEGDRCLTQLKDGTLDQFSIGYNYVWDAGKIEYNLEDDCFDCKELYLAEGSVVTLSCNALAQFEGMKSEEREAAALRIKAGIEEELKGIGFTKSYKLRQLISEQLALASVEPPAALKQGLQAAGDRIDIGLDFGAIANTFKN